MTKLKPIAIALMVAGASTMAIANEDAPAPPAFYDNGPASPLTNETDINYAERKAYAGLEAAMTVLEAYVRKLNKPVEKWWQRSKSRRSNSFDARTVFQKDRLVGNTRCRITIQTDGINAGDWFEQYGTAEITRVNPSAATPELDSVQNTVPEAP